MTSNNHEAWINDESVSPLASVLDSKLLDPMGAMPSDCPVCLTPRSLHIHLHRFRAYMGGAWIWCSSCRRYDHDRRSIPAWWTNNPAIALDIATSPPPVALDERAEIIDSHWTLAASGGELGSAE